MEIELGRNESVLYKQNAVFWNVNSSMGRLSNQNGTVYLTNQRILLYKVSTSKKLLLGVLSSLTEGNVLEAELMLNEITNIETNRPLGMGWQYKITTTSGQCYCIVGKSEMGELLSKLVFEKKTSNVQDENLSQDDALDQLKKAKDKLELGLLTPMEYEIFKKRMVKFMDSPKEKLETTMKCPHCNSHISTGMKFCPSCGKELPSEPKNRFCSQCGSEISSGMNFCSKCGNQIKD